MKSLPRAVLIGLLIAVLVLSIGVIVTIGIFGMG